MPKVGVAPIRRREIFEAATRIVAEKGLHRATMRDIAEAANVSTGTVQYYFRSKENLLGETLTFVSERIQRRAIRAMGSHETAEAKLEAIMRALLPKGPDRRRDWQVWFLAWSEATQSQDIRENIMTRMGSWDDLVIGVLEQWPSGPHAPDVLRSCARDLNALLNGLSVDLYITGTNNDPHEIQRAADSLLGLVRATLER
jgi:AcrR family transcriptional regulator